MRPLSREQAAAGQLFSCSEIGGPPKRRAISAPMRHSARQATNNSTVPVAQRASLRIVKELGLLGPREKMTAEVAKALLHRFDEPLTDSDITIIAKLTRLDGEALRVMARMDGPDGVVEEAAVCNHVDNSSLSLRWRPTSSRFELGLIPGCKDSCDTKLQFHMATEIVLRLDVAQENRRLSDAEYNLRKLLKLRLLRLAAVRASP
ncbi:Histidyl-tRNA synthetase [Hordeum vulgare]|nr:Histidyl-tRNA synthetase [Hordeum vulgare]